MDSQDSVGFTNIVNEFSVSHCPFSRTLYTFTGEAYLSTILLNLCMSQVSILKVATHPVLNFCTTSEKRNLKILGIIK